MTILDEIVDYKKSVIRVRRSLISEEELKERCTDLPGCRGFADNLHHISTKNVAIIAEIKRGSPSLGCIRPDMDALAQAKAYEKGGAAAISCLTDEKYFFGSDDDYSLIRESVTIPMLRKEFIIEPYQIYESRLLGADCILLIMAILSDQDAARLSELALSLGMDVLAETHNKEEIDRAKASVDFSLIGINNRNLKTFETSVDITLGLAEFIDDRKQLVAESGLHSVEVLRQLSNEGIRKFLIGEAFVKSDTPDKLVNCFVNLSNDRMEL
jgi:indole-3-glycerol phosphate synthase